MRTRRSTCCCRHHHSWVLVFLLFSWRSRSCAALVQVRTSRLEHWQPQQQQQQQPTTSSSSSSSSSPTTIGWLKEERDIAQQTYRVSIIGKESLDNDGHDKNAMDKKEDSRRRCTEVHLPFMTSAEENSSSLGTTLWPSSLAAAILFQCHDAFRMDLPASTTTARQAPPLKQQQQQRVLELGAGLGLPGRVLAQQTMGVSHVELTDNCEVVLQRLQREFSSENDNNSGSVLSARRLEWRDTTSDDNNNTEQQQPLEQQPFDRIIGSDVAYYFFLLRALMDTIQAFSYNNNKEADASSSLSTTPTKSTSVVIVGQANRESSWDLYHNLRDGCYNQVTDQHEEPWSGTTQMLLYKLHMQDWQEEHDNDDKDDDNSIEETDVSPSPRVGTVPVAVLVHEGGQAEELLGGRLTANDHVATAQDEADMELTF